MKASSAGLSWTTGPHRTPGRLKCSSSLAGTQQEEFSGTCWGCERMNLKETEIQSLQSRFKEPSRMFWHGSRAEHWLDSSCRQQEKNLLQTLPEEVQHQCDIQQKDKLIAHLKISKTQNLLLAKHHWAQRGDIYPERTEHGTRQRYKCLEMSKG